MFSFLSSDAFKKAFSFVTVIAAGLVGVLPSHTIAYKIALGVVGLAGAHGVSSNGTGN